MLDDVFHRAATTYGVYNPNDRSEGYAARLRGVVQSMEDRRAEIERALVYACGTHTFDQLVRMVVEGHVSFWCLPNGFMISEIINYPNDRHFHVFLAGGVLEELVAMHPDVVPVAQALGCTKITLSGRPGWVRALKEEGWQPHLVTLAKEVTQ
jgi:hypothetical protein